MLKHFPKLAPKLAPFVNGILQAAITTSIATAVATFQLTGWGMLFLERWMTSWSLAWITMLPVVILVAPLIHRLVVSMTAPEPQVEQF